MTSITQLSPHAATGPGYASKAETVDTPTTPQPTGQSSSEDGTPTFISPVTKVDANTGIWVQVYRDESVGTEINQYPSKHVVEEYARHRQEMAAGTASSQSSDSQSS
ncbi:hypothetical protein MCP1_270012 [Candidatus Terasakiella magnetica]|nr:hypothetical protein MCP1_270012 [Candidatus Terasakiella magnetica]